MPELFVVALEDRAAIWGPFATREDAEKFAAFAAAEIDPAEVRTLSSPVGELLAWRETMLRLNHG